MNYLLDTHTWLWLQAEPDQLPDSLLERLSGADRLLLSAASAWEIAIKFALDRLPLPEAPEVYIPDRLSRSGTEAVAIEIPHVLAAANLPMHHRDPFDRLLIAQSRLLSVPLVSRDSAFSSYEVDLLWE